MATIQRFEDLVPKFRDGWKLEDYLTKLKILLLKQN
jgi:hypothetical protein